MLIQLIVEKGEIYILEFSARTGGGTKFLRIRHLTGFDVVGAVVDLTEGKKPRLEISEKKQYLADEFLYCKPGRFDRLDGFEELKNQGVIADFYVFKWRGAEFDQVESSGDRVAGFTIVADTYEELQKKHRTVAGTVRVLDMDGNDMLRHDLLTDL
jgi:hypothetical protein